MMLVKKLITKYISLIQKIPERHYWPIFIILSLYFIVPMSEITVTLAAILYFKFEKKISPVVGKLTKRLPDWLRYGGSVIFFLVMIDDTIFYFALIALAFWSSKQVRKKTVTPSLHDDEEVLQYGSNKEPDETNRHS
tara:strand:+ start:743 stop:1153 length:411 start_codon:yes stop_codon:yes gene_type:complete